MTTKELLIRFKEETWDNAVNNILPFWRDYTVDEQNGGFYGAVGEDLLPVPNEPKSAVVNSRILWGMANAYDRTHEDVYASLAKRAWEYIRDFFWDKEYGGVYWMVGAKGDPFDTVKRTYAQACFLYAVAEYYDVFHDKEALDYVMKLTTIMIEKVKSPNGGYRDSSSRDWQPDLWLNTWSMNGHGAPMLLNSHLHLFESYALLYKSTRDDYIKDALSDMLRFLLENGVEYDTWHLKAGMDMECRRIDNEISFGHDLECAYLMMDAAETLEDKDSIEKVAEIVVKLAENAVNEGQDKEEGGVASEMDKQSGYVDQTKIWWVQCEAITGFLCAYSISHDEKFLLAAWKVWEYVKQYMLYEDGLEWKGVGGHINDTEESEKLDARWKALLGPTKMNKTKCPYHNSRAMFGVTDRINRVLECMG